MARHTQKQITVQQWWLNFTHYPSVRAGGGWEQETARMVINGHGNQDYNRIRYTSKKYFIESKCIHRQKSCRQTAQKFNSGWPFAASKTFLHSLRQINHCGWLHHFSWSWLTYKPASHQSSTLPPHRHLRSANKFGMWNILGSIIYLAHWPGGALKTVRPTRTPNQIPHRWICTHVDILRLCVLVRQPLIW